MHASDICMEVKRTYVEDEVNLHAQEEFYDVYLLRCL